MKKYTFAKNFTMKFLSQSCKFLLHTIILLCSLFFLFKKNVHSQTLFIPDAGVQVSLHVGNAQYKDLLFNGLRNNGITMFLDVGYAIKAKKLHHEVKVGAGVAKMWNRYGWDSNALQYGVQYRLLTPVSEGFQLGGNVGYGSSFYKNENVDSHHSYWRTNFTLGLSACYQIPLNYQWTLFVPLNVPLIGGMSRPDADRALTLNEPNLQVSDVLKRAHSKFQFVALGYRFFNIELGFSFQVKLNANNRLAIGYQIQYEFTNLSRTSHWLAHLVGIQYSFKKTK